MDNASPVIDFTAQNCRMKVAFGAAQSLEYLHDKANPPVICRDFNSLNILLDEAFNLKLSDFGLAMLGPAGDEMHVLVQGYGYLWPFGSYIGNNRPTCMLSNGYIGGQK
ncbi:hypothetical protein EUGRSUZ_B01434 [Eucalyptus grandis]|uniref:Uncharacterized protein n=2 Tax=Eucalyptus grandis TaxID=71139 RepID=A0ACC3LSH3_EUCGR|nr:hypothetical protein EUGRSUZ_B01434 [Eucalyptus grandis]